MKIVNFLLFITLFLSLSANAQRKKASNTLLWQVSGKGLAKPSYIFGTYHFADKGFVDTMKVLNEKLASADAIVGELVIDKQLALKLLPFMVMKDNSLDKLLTPDEYQLVSDFMNKFPGYQLKLFNTMKPIVIQTIILQLTSPKTFTPNNPAIDEYFQTYGKANHKAIYGLETPEEQANVLFGTSLQRQKELLLKYIKDEEKNKKESEKLYRYYITQDLARLEKLFNDISFYTAAEMDSLLKNRNLKWLQKLPNMMEKKSLFIAVGAGHLLGKNGLIKGLQAQGYTVLPIGTN